MANTHSDHKSSSNAKSETTKVTATGLRKLIGLSNENWLLPFVEDHLIQAREARYDVGWFHPSSLHSLCDRKLAFEYLGIKRQDHAIRAQTLRIFHNGEMVHRRWQAYFRAMKLLVEKEAKFVIDSPPIRGSADAIIVHPVSGDHSIVEIKSINSNGFSRLDAPMGHHFDQLNIYLGGHKIRDGLVLYENKNTQEVKVFPVKFDQTRFDQLQFRLLKIMHKLNKSQLPDVFNHDGCKTCPFLGTGCYTMGNNVEEVVEKYGT